jgi:predicted kinase
MTIRKEFPCRGCRRRTNVNIDLLVLGLTAIIEWGTWVRSERDALRRGSRDIGAAVELHYLSAPVDVLFERIRQRARENPPIERDRLLRWIDTFEEPTLEEIELFDRYFICDAARCLNRSMQRLEPPEDVRAIDQASVVSSRYSTCPQFDLLAIDA